MKHNLFSEGKAEQESLVVLAQEGDRQAFMRLFQGVQQSLYRAACVILQNDQDAYDATQEAALKAFRFLRSLRQPQFFKTWITRILINECRGILREKRKMSYYPDMNNWHINLREAAGAEINVLEAVNHLTFNYRTVVVLRYLDGYSQKEIARILGCPIGTVKSRINLALRKLKEGLVVQDFPEPHSEEGHHAL
ncbi:MAG: sigma-70 family RNA polymerase sigma factor [Coprothermobacterota bacterium]|nr:sigma-70 family RNA polymerase sigma factor [Coprothermobacterota bacterium]